MQSDTFLNDTDSSDQEYESDSSGDLPKTNNVGVIYDYPKEDIINERFMDQSKKESYMELRNELFTPKLETARICFYTHKSGSHDNILLADNLNYNNVKNVIGIEMITSNVLQTSAFDSPYVDLFIPEIPHKACKINDNGIPIISRLKCATNGDTDNYIETEPQRSYNNYFTPIQLNKLTLNLIKVDGGSANGDYKVFYEFEITILKDSLSKR